MMRQLTVNEGLPENNVTDVVQDGYGFIWVSTYDGLSRYDGKTVKSYRHDPENLSTINYNRIKSLHYDDVLKELWIGTDGGGINVYDYGTDSFSRLYLTADTAPMTPENDILDMVSESEGRVWVATRKSLFLVERTDAGLVSLQCIPYMSGPIFRQIVQKENHLFIAYNTEVHRFKKMNSAYVFDSVLKLPEGSRVNSVSIGNDGRLYVSAKKFLCFAENAFSSKTLTKVTATIDDAHDVNQNWLAVTFDNEIPLAVIARKGLYQIEGLPDRPVAKRLETGLDNFWTDIRVCRVLVDRNGTLWVTSSTKGVGIVDLSHQRFNLLSLSHNGSGSSAVSSLMYDEGVLWVGTLHGSLYRYVSDESVMTYEIPSGTISDIFKDGDTVYACIFGNVLASNDEKNPKSFHTWYSDDSDKTLPSLGHAYCVRKDSHGSLWVGCRKGVMSVRNGVVLDTVAFDSQNPVKLLYDSSADRLWISSARGGLKQVDLDEEGRIKSTYHYRHSSEDKNTMRSDVVWAVNVSKDSVVYVGTDAGLFVVDPLTHVADRVKSSGVLYNRKVLAITIDSSGILWLNTSNGIVRYEPATGKEVLFDSSDGLSGGSMTAAALVTQGDTLYVGTSEGVNWFAAQDAVPFQSVAQVTVSGFKVSSRHVHCGEKIDGKILLSDSIFETEVIELQHDQNNISFEISVLSFDNSRDFYAYRLRGYNEDWILSESTASAVNYRNLRPGVYTFEVTGVTDDMIPSGEVRSIKVCVRPAPWASIPAFCLYAVILAIVICVLFKAYRKYQAVKYERLIENIRQQEIQKSNENKLRLYVNITHELRTPLTLITAPLLELEARKDLPEDIKQLISIMKRNGDRLMEIVNSFLDLSKLESYGLQLEVSHVDCLAILRKVSSRFEMLIGAKKIDFRIDSESETFFGWFDVDKLSVIFANLLSNAFKYTEDNGSIVVKVRRIDDGCELTVADNGCGILPEDMPHIFERFYQASSTSASGTGIGLDFVKRLVDINKGHIRVDSKSGEGAAFCVWLPCSDDICAVADKVSMKGDVAMAPGSSSEVLSDEGHKKVLVVEDDHDMRNYVRSILEKEYVVVEASDGQQGYIQALSETPDIIISDMMMPNMSGAEFCRKLSEDYRVSHIPVILLSAKSAESEGLRAGAVDYIMKPFVPDNLLLKVNNLLRYWENRNIGKRLDLTIREKIGGFQKEKERAFLERAYRIVEENLSNSEFSVETFGSLLFVSKTQLHNKMTSLTGDSASAFIRNIRLDKAQEMLSTGKYSITEVLYSVGFNSPSYFSKKFKERFGKLPSDYISE